MLDDFQEDVLVKTQNNFLGELNSWCNSILEIPKKLQKFKKWTSMLIREGTPEEIQVRNSFFEFQAEWLEIT